MGIILQAIGEKKGENLVTIDLRKTGDAVCDFFVICEASTGTQLRGIAENVVKRLQEETGEKPWHTEGMQQLDWILLDYVHVVVHLFRRPLRGFYQLEELWSDGIIEEHND